MAAIVGKLEGFGSMLLEKAWALLDSLCPPERRAEWIAKLKAFTIKHPKVMSFLLTNLALTGGPLAFFIIFGITVFVFSLIVALVVGLLIAVCFTLFCLGLALMILFPVVFFTTLSACFLFLTGLGGYWAFKWMNKGDKSLPTAKGDALGDQINNITGGKLNWLMNQVREGKVEQALGPLQGEWREPSARNTPVNGGGSGSGSGSGHTPKKLNRKSDGKGNNNNNNSSNNATVKTNGMGNEKKKKDIDDGNDKENAAPSGVSTEIDSVKNAGNVGSVTKGVKQNANTEGVTKAINSTTGAVGAGDVGKQATDATSKATGTVKGGLGSTTGLA